MTTAVTYDIKGEEIEKTKLPEKIFGVRTKPVVLALAVRVYLSNQRQAAAKVKTRAEVAKTTAKMYRQKGTGKARHGSYAAPIFVGGGVAHGPTGEQNYKLKLPTKIRRLTLLAALSDKARAKNIAVLSGAKTVSGRAKDAVKTAAKMKVGEGKVLLIVQGDQEKLIRAWRNLSKVTTTTPESLSAYLIMAHKQLVITAEALEALGRKYAN